MIKLHEPDISLDHAAREQTIRAEGSRVFVVHAVGFQGLWVLFGQIGEFRHGGLHAKSQFICSNTGSNFDISCRVKLAFVEIADRIEPQPLGFLADASRTGNMEDGISAAAKSRAAII